MRCVPPPEIALPRSTLPLRHRLPNPPPVFVGRARELDALLAALMALGVGPGTEVVTTAFSFFATAGAIARLGARPVFADIDEHFNLDPDDVFLRVTPRTRAILPASLFGRRCDVERLGRVGRPILEDAAQAFGAPGVGKGRNVHAATLSFYPSKNLGALGDAGMVVTDSPTLADLLRLVRGHGARPKYHHLVLGGNFRLDAMQAALLRVKLPHLAAWNEARRRNAAFYREALADLAGHGDLVLPEDAPGHIWHHFVVRVLGEGRREALRRFLQEQGIETEIYYPEPLHLQPCFAELGGRPGDHPRAEAAAREALAIPVHPELDEAQRAHVVAAMQQFFRTATPP